MGPNSVRFREVPLYMHDCMVSGCKLFVHDTDIIAMRYATKFKFHGYGHHCIYKMYPTVIAIRSGVDAYLRGTPSSPCQPVAVDFCRVLVGHRRW